MDLALYQVDAFADQVFEGNPAAVCPLDTWLPDAVMQAIAAENNLSETAFFVREADNYHIRWFTPVAEVDLCGHATLASAHVLFHVTGIDSDTIVFNSRSGELKVRQQQDRLELDFPAQPGSPRQCPEILQQAFGRKPLICLRSEDYIFVLENEQQVLAAAPDMVMLRSLDGRGVAITAPGQHHDFVARFFVPKLGVDEDPVTGSIYTQLVPYWADVLGKTKLAARQLSRRGGNVYCELAGDRVRIAGGARLYMQGTICL
ncbi:MAG: PhzF family phenazine biosynthesis protein [Gammaproteobacteria bacterium]|nr:PhzF family phenazine biosynthesis protein [Gammaproteobacteria bacterium]